MSRPAHWLTPIAAPEVRRVEVFACVLGLLAAAGLWIAVGRNAALVLTLTAAVGIVHFRALQVQVRLLAPRSDGRPGGEFGLLALVRLTFVGTLTIGALFLGSRYPLALILGFSVIPAALMAEALLRVAGIVRGVADGG